MVSRHSLSQSRSAVHPGHPGCIAPPQRQAAGADWRGDEFGLDAYRSQGVTELDRLDRCLLVLVPNQHVPVVTRTGDQPPPCSSDLDIDRVYDSGVTAESADDLSGGEVVEEDSVVG